MIKDLDDFSNYYTIQANTYLLIENIPKIWGWKKCPNEELKKENQRIYGEIHKYLKINFKYLHTSLYQIPFDKFQEVYDSLASIINPFIEHLIVLKDEIDVKYYEMLEGIYFTFVVSEEQADQLKNQTLKGGRLRKKTFILTTEIFDRSQNSLGFIKGGRVRSKTYHLNDDDLFYVSAKDLINYEQIFRDELGDTLFEHIFTTQYVFSQTISKWDLDGYSLNEMINEIKGFSEWENILLKTYGNKFKDYYGEYEILVARTKLSQHILDWMRLGYTIDEVELFISNRIERYNENYTPSRAFRLKGYGNKHPKMREIVAQKQVRTRIKTYALKPSFISNFKEILFNELKSVSKYDSFYKNLWDSIGIGDKNSLLFSLYKKDVISFEDIDYYDDFNWALLPPDIQQALAEVIDSVVVGEFPIANIITLKEVKILSLKPLQSLYIRLSPKRLALIPQQDQIEIARFRILEYLYYEDYGTITDIRNYVDAQFSPDDNYAIRRFTEIMDELLNEGYINVGSFEEQFIITEDGRDYYINNKEIAIKKLKQEVEG